MSRETGEALPRGGTRRVWEIVVAVAFAAVAGVGIYQSIRLGAGYRAAGPGSGFFPLWVSIPLLVCALLALWQSIRRPGQPRGSLFESNDDFVEFFKVGVPLAAAVISMAWLGFYLAAAAYLAVFTGWYGRYPWWVVVGSTVVFPVLFYVVFERAFSILLPKSIFYGPQIPF